MTQRRFFSALLFFLNAILVFGQGNPSANYPAPVQGDFVVRGFQFESSETLPEVKLHYRTIGTLQRDATGNARNAVLILHGTHSLPAIWKEHLAALLEESK